MVKELTILFICQYENICFCQRISLGDLLRYQISTIYLQWNLLLSGRRAFEILCVNYVYLERLYLFSFSLLFFSLSLYDALRGLALSLWCLAWLIVFPVAGHFAGNDVVMSWKITLIEFEDTDVHSQVRAWLLGLSSRSGLIN